MTRAFLAALAAALAVPAAAQRTAHAVSIGESTIDVTIAGTPQVPETMLLAWVETSARGVASYLGRFPVPRVRLAIETGGRGGVGGGVTRGGRVPSIRIRAGDATDRRALDRDWVLAHEFLHLGFPDLTTDDSWAEEGLSTYAEPLARARVGLVRAEGVWSDLVNGLPQGLARGGAGLHGTGDWGRTYWGGALFWLQADVRIREATRNRKGLPDALGAILAAGGDIRAEWTLERTLATGDRALGLTVLLDLYRAQGLRAEVVDLEALWRRLGVRAGGRAVSFDDAAPLASVRRAIDGTAATPSR